MSVSASKEVRSLEMQSWLCEKTRQDAHFDEISEFQNNVSTTLIQQQGGTEVVTVVRLVYEVLILNFCFFINSQQAKGFWNNYVNFRFIWTREIILNDDSGKCDREDLYKDSFL